MTVPPPPPTAAVRREIVIDGLVTSYLEAGEGEPLLLLHSGEFGGSSELSWEYCIDEFAQTHRVIAPDWLGYGESAKVYDFLNGTARLVSHTRRFCDELALAEVPIVASSMGASLLLADAASANPQLPASAIVAINGGGDVSRNPHTDALFEFDGTIDAMRALVEALFVGDEWMTDETYIRRRHAQATSPGAWECVAAPRFHSPEWAASGAKKPKPPVDYSRIGVPTLIVAGELDKIKPPDWAVRVQAQIAGAELLQVPQSGHFPHLERAQSVNALILQYLSRAQNLVPSFSAAPSKEKQKEKL